MMRRALVALVAALALAGCAVDADPPGDITVSVADPTVLDRARAAAAEWNACGGRQIHIETTPSDEAIALELVENHADLAPGTDLPSGSVAITASRVSGTPLRIRVIRRYATQTIIAHELGHALLGRPHAASGLMAAEQDMGVRHVTERECGGAHRMITLAVVLAAAIGTFCALRDGGRR